MADTIEQVRQTARLLRAWGFILVEVGGWEHRGSGDLSTAGRLEHHTDGTLAAVDTLIAGGEGEWFAGVLIGPGALVLAKGTHHVTARVADAPESVEPLPAQYLLVQ